MMSANCDTVYLSVNYKLCLIKRLFIFMHSPYMPYFCFSNQCLDIISSIQYIPVCSYCTQLFCMLAKQCMYSITSLFIMFLMYFVFLQSYSSLLGCLNSIYPFYAAIWALNSKIGSCNIVCKFCVSLHLVFASCSSIIKKYINVIIWYT